MMRTKIVALLLGPTGVGLVALYAAAIELVGTIARLGINESGVREVAEAYSSGDPARAARTITTLRRACWVTGILGWLITAALSFPLSVWTFGSVEHGWAFAILGAAVLIAAIAGGQTALLQGTRRIGDLARVGVLAAFVSTILAAAIYGWLREKGIVLVLLATAAVNLGFSWWFARNVQYVEVPLTLAETILNSKRLVGLGLAFMYGALMASLVGLAIRSFIVREFGLGANGIYQAAWGISGMFAGFILGAMGTDFYPRLTAVSSNNEQVNRLVNEQIEVGVLLALPGLLATLAFAPWIMHLFYSAKFIPAASLLPWLALGIFGQVISFPLGYIQRAKGTTRWIYLSQSHINLLHLVLVLVLVRAYGVVAAAWAFALATYIHGLVTLGIARRLSRFAWSASSARLGLIAAGLVAVGFTVQLLADGLVELALGALLMFVAMLFSARGICSRLGPAHRLVKMMRQLPGSRLLCGL